jgi:hypothetical protein
MIFQLIVLSCAIGAKTCKTEAAFFSTDQECAHHAPLLADRLAVARPKAKITFFCYPKHPTG